MRAIEILLLALQLGIFDRGGIGHTRTDDRVGPFAVARDLSNPGAGAHQNAERMRLQLPKGVYWNVQNFTGHMRGIYLIFHARYKPFTR